MKREEQTRVMREKIVNSAIQEFNEHNYETASMNHICELGDLSKGIIYHYFKDKDELYLKCVEQCFVSLATYYKENEGMLESVDIANYMKVRMNFFKEHPEFRNLFFHALLQTPPSLEKELGVLVENIEEINVEFYKQFIKNLQLRENITFEKAMRYMDMIQTLFNDYFRKEAQRGCDFEEVIKKHEAMIPEWIDFVLHGIAKEEKG